MAKVLILNSKSEICGVHQYGLTVYDILKKSNKTGEIKIRRNSDELCGVARGGLGRRLPPFRLSFTFFFPYTCRSKYFQLWQS